MRTFVRLFLLCSALPMTILSGGLWGDSAPRLRAFYRAGVFLHAVFGVVVLTVMGALTTHGPLFFSVGHDGKTDQTCSQE
jgi:hypothetical protein